MHVREHSNIFVLPRDSFSGLCDAARALKQEGHPLFQKGEWKPAMRTELEHFQFITWVRDQIGCLLVMDPGDAFFF